MARTSKTDIGAEAGDRARASREAMSEGQAGVRQEHESLMAQQERGQEFALRASSEIGQFTQREREREQQASQFKSKLAQEDTQFSAQQDQQREFETGRQALEQQKLGIEAADRGVAPTGNEPQSPLLQQQGQSARMQRLQAEMDQGGGAMAQGPTREQQLRADQTGRKLEQTSPTQPIQPGYEQTAGRKALDQQKADTARMNAETYRMTQTKALQDARARGDKEAEKAVLSEKMLPIKSDEKMLDTFANGKQTDYDWTKFKQMAGPAIDNDPELKKEVDSGVAGKRVLQILESKKSQSVFNYVKETHGSLPSEHLDMSSPTMQVFTQNVKHYRDLITTMVPGLGQFAGFKSMDDRNRMLNRLAVARTEQMSGGFFERAARGINEGIASMGGGGGPQQGPNPMQGMVPSAGQPQPQQQPNTMGPAKPIKTGQNLYH